MSKNKCPNCGKYNLDINGLFFTCKDCGFIDDTTFNMIEKEQCDD